MIKLKSDEGDPHQDLRFWEWALTVIQRLQAEGMSSDESADDAVHPGAQIYRVKIMIWRRRMEDILQIIDQARHSKNGIYSLSGSTGLTRTRPPVNVPADWPQSTRNPVEALPYIFYDQTWFHRESPDVRAAVLHVTAEEFQWAQVFSRNSS